MSFIIITNYSPSLRVPVGDNPGCYLIMELPISFYLVLSVQTPSDPKGVKHIINGNDQESPPAIYYGGGTQYVYTKEYNSEVIKSLGVIKQEVILNVKVRHIPSILVLRTPRYCGKSAVKALCKSPNKTIVNCIAIALAITDAHYYCIADTINYLVPQKNFVVLLLILGSIFL